MKDRARDDGIHGGRERAGGSDWSKNAKKRRNMMRLGGAGLSLEAFANAKSKSNDYNPAIIKKKREFYRNAKFVKKYKKTLKEEAEQSDNPSVFRSLEEENHTEDAGRKLVKKKNKSRSQSLREVYEQKHEEEEKSRTEREAIMQKRKEERERVIAKRKDRKKKMFKRTESGQPKMKYRIEHLLETIQKSTS